ncbi:GtrA family protein [Streptomyces sp. CA-181903]|uniref:GtrA family protein n=1 Tax=Streptomyces sp. CA-181903 TaxID=3240055 RepID=UPI003D915BDE
MSHRRAVRSRLERLVREIAKFGAIGAVGFVVNTVVFNMCRHSGLAVVRSGVIATCFAIAANYVGNRYWTYRDCDKSRRSRELTLFLLFSGVGLVIENGILALSHYGFGFTSTVADNIAKNVVGLGIGTVFRFWSYRTWVFKRLPVTQAAVEAAESFLAQAPQVTQAPAAAEIPRQRHRASSTHS